METMSIESKLQEIFHMEYFTGKYVREGIPNVHDLHIPVFAKEFPYPADAFDLEKQILDKISVPFGGEGTLSTLILGDSGSGKSWLAHKVTKSLFETLDLKLKFPLYISLRAVEEVSCQRSSDCKPEKTYQCTSICFHCRKPNNIVFAYLQMHCTNETPERIDQMYRSLIKFELILFLDGYDELQDKVNLWSVNKWGLDKYRVRTYVFGKSSSLLNTDISDLFIFCKDGKRREAVQYVITPLEDKLVGEYIQRVPFFLKGIDLEKCASGVNDPWIMTKCSIVELKLEQVQVKSEVVRDWESDKVECSEYHYWFYKMLPELQGLSRNVYLLTIICQVLPILVEEKNREISDPDKFVTALKQICETEVSIYDEFTKAWVGYQVNKIKESGDTLGKIEGVLKFYMFAYAQNLTIHCINCNKRALFNGTMDVGVTEFWNLWVPLDPYDPNDPNEPKFKRDVDLEMSLFPRDDKDEDEGRLKNLRSLRNASLLRFDTQLRKFEFFHLSLLEYFVSRDIFVNIRAQLNFYINHDRGNENYFIINKSNITEFPGILNQVVEKVQQDTNLQEILLNAVNKSAEFPGISIMASNAMTILNLSGYNFSGNQKDFRNIQVPYANLSRAICGNSDFTGANFKGANLSEGWFQNCRFQGANFAECHFGQHCPVELEQGIFVYEMLCYYKAGLGSNKGVYQVFLIIRLDNQDFENLYCKTFEYSTDFRLIASNQFFVLKLTVDPVYLVNKGENVYLLILTKTFLDEMTVLVPKTLYELDFTSIVNTIDIDFQVSQLKFSSTASKSLHKRYIIIEEVPRFATENEFFENYTQQKSFCSKTNRRLPVHLTLFSWLPVGSLKLLICTHFQLSRDVDITDIYRCVTDTTVLQRGLLTLLEGEVESFEVWWCPHNLNFFGYKLSLDKLVFDGMSTLSLCLSEWIVPEERDKNVFYFDLHKSTRLPYIKKTDKGQSSRRKRLVVSNYNVAIWDQDKVIFEFNFRDAIYFTVVNYKFSAELDYVARKKLDSIEITNTITGRVEKVVPTGFFEPFAFVTSFRKTCFAYINKKVLNLIKLSNTTSEFVLESGANHRKSVRSRIAAFGGLIDSNDRSLPNVLSIHSACVVRELMVISNQIIICKTSHSRHVLDCTLIAFTSDGKAVHLIGVPNNNRFDCWELYLLKRQERILVGTPKRIVSVYKLQNTNKPVLEKNQLFDSALELVELSSTRSKFQVNDFTLVSTTQNGSFLICEVQQKTRNVVYWDAGANFITELSVEGPAKFSEKANKGQVACCFYKSYRIHVGNVDLEQQRFYVTNILETRSAGLAIHDSTFLHTWWNPIFQLSPTLHWLSILTIEGEIVILDSDSLQHMFSFRGMNKGVELYVEEFSGTSVRIITWTLFSHETWLKINAESLRKCFESKTLDNFRDWSVEKSELPSTTLSLYRTDIEDLRGIEKGHLDFLKYFESEGNPSDDLYVPFCSLFEPVTDSVESMFSMTGQGLGGPVDLTEKWTVTVIAKKSKVLQRATVDWHSGLVLEGIHYNRHFVIRAHLVLRKGGGSVGVLKGNSETHKVKVWSLGAGNKSGYLDIVNNYVATQYEVSKEKGMKLLENIWGDTRQKWSYSLWKNNCNTWCKLKLALIGYKIPKRKMLKKFPDHSKDFFEKQSLKDQLGRSKKQ